MEAFFSATSNPFIALMVGILATTLVQSSSVTTSMVVGLVAAPENPLPLANAVPMIMGAKHRHDRHEHHRVDRAHGTS